MGGDPDQEHGGATLEGGDVRPLGHRALIGSLDRIEAMMAGTAGTQVCTEAAGGADTL